MKHPYKPSPWIGPGSPIVAMHQSSWNLAKLYTPTTTLGKVRTFCRNRNRRCKDEEKLKCSTWTAGYYDQTEGQRSLVSVAHGLDDLIETRDIVFLTEVAKEDQISNGFYPETRIVEVGSSFSHKLDRSKAIDILKVKICDEADQSLFHNKVKAACSSVYHDVEFDFNLPPTADAVGKPVTKRGIATGETYGTIAELQRFYCRPGARSPLEDCVVVKPGLLIRPGDSGVTRGVFAGPGDSGSLVVSTSNGPGKLQAYGLVLRGMDVVVEDEKMRCVVCSKLDVNLSALTETRTQSVSHETAS